MDEPYKPNIVCVLADLSQIPKPNRSPLYGILSEDSQTLIGAGELGKIKGLASIKRILSTSLLENILSGESELLKQIKQHANQDSIYILTHWERPEDITAFYEGELHQPLSEHGFDLIYEGVKLIIFQYINGKLNEPVIIKN